MARIARRIKRVPRQSKKPDFRGVILVDRARSGTEENFLKGIGINPGRYNKAKNGYTNAVVPYDAMTLLDPHWGRFYWSLHGE